MTDILAFDTDHIEEFETLLVDGEENYVENGARILNFDIYILHICTRTRIK